MTEQVLIFLAFLAAFAVKVPMWPVHTWLPDAHVEAPTGGSVILAAIMLKMGGYGFLRFSLPIAPDASRELDWLIITLSLIAVVYIGFVALVQHDMKKLIAYSSIAHMGFVTLGSFIAFDIVVTHRRRLTGAAMGLDGAMVQMISHGLVSGALFFCVGVLYDRLHTREICRLRRRRQHHAGLRVLRRAVRDGERRPARHLRIRRRVPGDPRELQGATSGIAFLAATTLILGRRLHAVAGEARDLGRRRQRRRCVAQGPQRARIPGARRCSRSRCWRSASGRRRCST